jgi:RNA polymerase sigma-70 factor (ECF subfamily)
MDPFPPPPEESRSLELVAAIQAGETSAWEELYRRYHDQLLLLVRLRLGSKLRAVLQSEDVFQSVALDALSALQRFEYRGEGSLLRFLRTLVLNKIRDRADTFGAQKRSGGVPLRTAVIDGLAAPDGDLRYHDAVAYERLERALTRLPDEQRDVLLQRKVDGLTSQEIAQASGRTDDAVRKLCSRAMARLATLMTVED